MKLKAILAICAVAPFATAEPASEVSIAGRTLKEIYGVSLTTTGDVSIITGRGTLKYKPGEVPTEFLESWGITREQLSDNTKRADDIARAEKEKKEAEDRKKAEETQREERKAFIQNSTRLFYAIQILDGGILANSATYSTRGDSMASQGGGGYAVRIPRRGAEVVFLTGYSAPDLTESSIISAAFVSDGTYIYTDTEGAKRVVPKLKYIKE
jgi:hypothetical protein